MSDTYVYAKLNRAGLGNNLITWARAEIFAHAHNLPLIAPHWRQVKLGPIVRRERDWRLYGKLFDHGGAIGGLKRLWLLKTSRIVPGVIHSDHVFAPPPASRGSQVIEFTYYSHHAQGQKFEQLGKLLEPLIPSADFLRKRLNDIARLEHRQVVDVTLNEPFIGIHFRRGDKPPLAHGLIYPPDTDHPTLPTEWYVRTLCDIRSKLGFDAPAVIFTDGRPDQLAPLMALPNVRLAPYHNALIDLLLLAKCRILISTLSSSFSRWAAILGKMPSVHYPGRHFSLVDARQELTMFTDVQGRLEESSASILQAAMPPEDLDQDELHRHRMSNGASSKYDNPGLGIKERSNSQSARNDSLPMPLRLAAEAM